MSIADCLCRIKSEHHERSSVSIGCCTVFCYDSRREYIVLYRIARTRVDSMRIFFTVFIVEVAVITRSGKSGVGDFEHSLQFLIYSQ